MRANGQKGASAPWLVPYLRWRRARRNGTNGASVPSHVLVRLLFVAILAIPAVFALGAFSAVSAMASVYQQYAKNLPRPEEVAYQSQVGFKTTKIYDRTGKVLLFEIYDPQGGNRTIVPIDRIPLHMRQATIAAEDRDFYTNPGVNLRGFVRAIVYNIAVREPEERPQGGSSITQQLVRNVMMSPEERFSVSMDRKIKETILALELSRRFSKEQILEWYLNTVPYGSYEYGVQAASEVFFGKNVEQLTLAEAAMLAALPRAPTIYSPLENFELAKERQELVLNSMWEEGYITQEELRAAKAEPIKVRRQRFEIVAPHFVMYVRKLLEERYGADLLYRGGLKVITTVDLNIQNLSEGIARTKVQELEKDEVNAHNAAVVVLEPGTGQILAMVGSLDYFDETIDGQVNMVTSPRQPGSSFKPFTYAEAFNQGYTPATLLLDIRTTFPVQPVPYIPENYDRRYHGPVLARQALACSYNIPAVRLLDTVGIQKVVTLARRMGINTLESDAYGLSLTLGGGEVSLLDMTYAYSVFANGGVMAGKSVPPEKRRAGYRELDPVALLRVEDAQGNLLEEYTEKSIQRKEILSSQVAYLISDILSDNNARTPAFGANSVLRLTRPAAVKTGTTDDWRDNWTIGYTPQVAVGVWVGNASGEAMRRVSGVSGAGPIWHDIMEKLLAPLPVAKFAEPDRLQRVEICLDSGLLPTQYCTKRRVEVFIKGTAPTAYDNVNRPFRICKTSGKLATIYCPPDQVEEKVFQVYPPELADWLRDNNIPQPPTEYDTTHGPAAGSQELAILSPSPYSFVKGNIPVQVRMKMGGVDRYYLEYGQGLDPSAWSRICGDHQGEMEGGVLENWETIQLDGLYTLQLIAVRGDGNTQRTSIQVTVDNKPPTVKLTYPPAGTGFSRANEFATFQVEAQDNSSLDRVDFLINDEVVGTATVAPYAVKWNIKSVAPGNYTLLAIAYDAAGTPTPSEKISIRIY